jgi:hypothetical protein
MSSEKIPWYVECLIIPKLSEISRTIKYINTRNDVLESNEDTRLDLLEDTIKGLRNETKMEISSLRTEMTIRLDSLEKLIPVIEEITALKLKIADMEKRLAMA